MSLIEDAKNKNPDAFEQLIQPQLQRMYRVAISMLHNEEDAADAIQETVLKCWQKIGQLKSEEYFGTWLTRILINQCKDILKERKKVVPLEEFPELIHEDHYFTNEWRKILSNLNGKYQIEKYGSNHLNDVLYTVYLLNISELLPEILTSISSCFTKAIRNSKEQFAKEIIDSQVIVDMIILKSFIFYSDEIKKDEKLINAYEDILLALTEIRNEKAAVLLDEFRIH